MPKKKVVKVVKPKKVKLPVPQQLPESCTQYDVEDKVREIVEYLNQ